MYKSLESVMVTTELPTIYDYTDFRQFLKDSQLARCTTDKRYTKSAICKRLGIPKTRSYFNDVLNGRNLSAIYIERFIAVFELDKEAAAYFRILVKFNQADNMQEREFYFDQIIAHSKTTRRIVTEDAYIYYSQWHHSVVRAALETIDFKDDYKMLAEKLYPPITEQMARESITLLKRLSLIEKNTDGYWRLTDKAITTGKNTHNELIKQYHLQCLELAKTSLLKNQTMRHSYSTNTMSISVKGYERLMKRIMQFKSEIRGIIHKYDDEHADRVYQMNIQLFPTVKHDKIVRSRMENSLG